MNARARARQFATNLLDPGKSVRQRSDRTQFVSRGGEVWLLPLQPRAPRLYTPPEMPEMNKITLALASAATLALSVGAVHAQVPAKADRGADMTRAQVEQRTAATFARLDANKDGKLDSADRAERQDAVFERIDTNGDGSISRAEFDARTDMRAERRAEAREGDRPRRGMMAMRGGRGPMGRGQMLQQADADKDGAITQAEFSAAMLARFDAADADKDGRISPEERRAARPGMMQRMPRQAG